MPVRLRITVLFSIIVFIILGLVCFSIYYFSHTSRINTIQTRLTNRAITTARLLSQSEIFDKELVRRIDSSTTISLKNKAVKAYDYKNTKVYNYSDLPGDTIEVDKDILDEVRVKGNMYFTIGEKDAAAYHYTDNNIRLVIIAAATDEDGKKYLNSLLNILLFSFLGGILIAFTSGYFFSGRLLQPIKKIADNVNEISAQHFTRRITTGNSHDEWYYLANTINKLLNRLQESFELQKRFISNASHELSTPLTSISSQLEVSLQRNRDAEEYRKVMNSVHQDVKQMSKLTQTLLEFAKASGSTSGIEIHSVRVDEILLRLPAEITKAGTDYSVSLQFDELPEDEKRLLVLGNEELLFTAIKNIVINACKYSTNHHATVTLSTNQQSIIITVLDTGPGIPNTELEKIFQPFYRVDESRTTEGFGLGLALTQRIIKLHKGDVKIESEIDKGSKFIISLPNTIH